MSESWKEDEKSIALASYVTNSGDENTAASASTDPSPAAAATGEGGEQKLSKNQLKKLAKGKGVR